MDLYNNFQDKLRDTGISVSALLSDFIDLYQNAASSMKRVMSFKVQSKQNASWWDKECSKAKYLKNNSLRHFRQTNSSQALDNYLHRKKHYTYVCKIKKVNQKLVYSRQSLKEFWKTLKGSSKSLTLPVN